MSNFKNLQEFVRINYTPVSAVTAGDVVVQGSFVGYATEDIAAGALGTLVVMGLTEGPKASGSAIAAGSDVYWDDEDEVITETQTDIYLGKTTLLAASAAVLARVFVYPTPASGEVS
jgi:predicted RecA/RadA family phage recombinase